MNQLFTISEYLTNGYKSEVLEVLSIFALFFGSIVIIIKNPIGSLLCLIGLFGVISVYLILVGLNFIGFSYLIVYIGAISILFLFILMLINIRTSELVSNNVNSIPLALLIIILLNYAWYQISPQYINLLGNSDNLIGSSIYADIVSEFTSTIISMFSNGYNNVAHIMFATSNNWDGTITETNHAASVGLVIYTVYNIWLLLASIILLLAMVGAIVITIK